MVKKALLLVDLQNDFIESSCLKVKNSKEIIDPICELLEFKNLDFDLVILSQDWHCKGHSSFNTSHNAKQFDVLEMNNPNEDSKNIPSLNQIMWPEHCIENTFGAEININIMKKINEIKDKKKIYFLKKGQQKELEFYSCFMDVWKNKKTELDAVLKKNNINDVYIGGLAFDYCVFHSAIDCANLNYNTYVIKNICRSVNPENDFEVIDSFKKHNISIVYI